MVKSCSQVSFWHLTVIWNKNYFNTSSQHVESHYASEWMSLRRLNQIFGGFSYYHSFVIKVLIWSEGSRLNWMT
jgi:hypothetical protein